MKMMKKKILEKDLKNFYAKNEFLKLYKGMAFFWRMLLKDWNDNLMEGKDYK